MRAREERGILARSQFLSIQSSNSRIDGSTLWDRRPYERSEMTSILRSPQALQLTLALIKPDAVAHPLILEAVHQQILSNKFHIVRMRELLWRKEECQQFYKEHEGRFFYQRLVEFMASGPIRAYILAHKDAIQLWRTLMGPTRVFRARHVAPDSIRGSFGLTDTRNTTHGSDEGNSCLLLHYKSPHNLVA
ncbi:nucleoside diphosphate kinase 6 isoform X2 [Mustela erminea]|uniref:nucleoside diphosphate kinase 6 isoform X2 n=1 Tax=Mustela erminea TaxID=36723 RepID=UPI00138663AA|nr:nucleoside diphosphate kinase 6 isoform X2 [Mustela erminea]